MATASTGLTEPMSEKAFVSVAKISSRHQLGCRNRDVSAQLDLEHALGDGSATSGARANPVLCIHIRGAATSVPWTNWASEIEPPALSDLGQRPKLLQDLVLWPLRRHRWHVAARLLPWQSGAKSRSHVAMTKDSRELTTLTPAYRVRTQVDGLYSSRRRGDPRLDLAVVITLSQTRRALWLLSTPQARPAGAITAWTRPAQQLSGERTDGFTQFSGLAGMMLVGAGPVPACCQGNETRDMVCRCLSQLRRAAWVHRRWTAQTLRAAGEAIAMASNAERRKHRFAGSGRRRAL
ncbi:hypothetical protein OPT61_g8452 [Boeremia exigua]|uniref:Uncharacterized protein n=1 Tax=Boeremia exigua TaxID=749465 RepID=A0ACC2HYM7_9PLEO|nr:hypothetical protein OPT61_g8452 [Boeremia exigua]